LGPWLCFRRWDGLSATNTLYIGKFRTHDVTNHVGLAIALLSSRVREQLVEVGRRYADGLIKFEPADLREIRIRIPEKGRNPWTTYRDALGYLLDGDGCRSLAIADAYCGCAHGQNIGTSRV